MTRRHPKRPGSGLATADVLFHEVVEVQEFPIHFDGVGFVLLFAVPQASYTSPGVAPIERRGFLLGGARGSASPRPWYRRCRGQVSGLAAPPSPVAANSSNSEPDNHGVGNPGDHQCRFPARPLSLTCSPSLSCLRGGMARVAPDDGKGSHLSLRDIHPSGAGAPHHGGSRRRRTRFAPPQAKALRTGWAASRSFQSLGVASAGEPEVDGVAAPAFFFFMGPSFRQ